MPEKKIEEMTLKQLDKEYDRLQGIIKVKLTSMRYDDRLKNDYYNRIVSRLDKVVMRIKKLNQ